MKDGSLLPPRCHLGAAMLRNVQPDSRATVFFSAALNDRSAFILTGVGCGSASDWTRKRKRIGRALKFDSIFIAAAVTVANLGARGPAVKALCCSAPEVRSRPRWLLPG